MPYASSSGRAFARRQRLAVAVLIAAVAFFAGASPSTESTTAQLVSTWVDLDDRQGAPDFPFGLNCAPDGSVYHVAIAGSFSTPNRHVAVIDRQTQSVVARYNVGQFPEEVAYTSTGGMAPSISRIFVTDSSDGTVSVLDDQGTPVTTIPLGANTYPFGIAVDQGQRRLAVTTKTGTLFVVDIATNRVTTTLSVDASHGRVTFLPDGRLAFASSTFGIGTATVFANLVDPDRVVPDVSLKLYGPSLTFPSCEDVAVVRDGQEVWFPLLNADDSIHRIDPLTGAPLGTISLASTFPGGGSLHGIAANGEGHVLVTAFNAASIALLRTNPPGVIGTTFLARGIQPNDAMFSPDGREACVTMQANAAGAHILTGLPTPRVRIATTGVEVGKPFTLTVRGAPAYSTSVVGMSLAGDGPTTILGLPVRLSLPIVPLHEGPHDARGRFSPPSVPIPAVPSLRGTVVHLQALFRAPDLSLGLSGPLTLQLR